MACWGIADLPYYGSGHPRSCAADFDKHGSYDQLLRVHDCGFDRHRVSEPDNPGHGQGVQAQEGKEKGRQR